MKLDNKVSKVLTGFQKPWFELGFKVLSPRRGENQNPNLEAEPGTRFCAEGAEQ